MRDATVPAPITICRSSSPDASDATRPPESTSAYGSCSTTFSRRVSLSSSSSASAQGSSVRASPSRVFGRTDSVRGASGTASSSDPADPSCAWSSTPNMPAPSVPTAGPDSTGSTRVTRTGPGPSASSASSSGSGSRLRNTVWRHTSGPSGRVRTSSTGWIPAFGRKTRSRSPRVERTGMVSAAPAAGSPRSVNGTVTGACSTRPAEPPSMTSCTATRRLSSSVGSSGWWMVTVSRASAGTEVAGSKRTWKSPSGATHGLTEAICSRESERSCAPAGGTTRHVRTTTAIAAAVASQTRGRGAGPLTGSGASARRGRSG